MPEWYRRKSWTKNDEEEFFAKLKRARIDGRAQYLKIQAIELVETKDNYLINVAENLLNKILIEYPDDKFNRSMVFHYLGHIYLHRADIEKLIHYFKQSLDFENEFPNVRTHSYLDYSLLIVKTEKTHLYDSVEKMIMDEFPDLKFPVEKYNAASILSIINHYKSNFDQAEYYYGLAEENASAKVSGFRYHKNLGLVTERDKLLDSLVKRK